MAELTDAEVFGTPAVAAPPPPVEMSDAEVFSVVPPVATAVAPTAMAPSVPNEMGDEAVGIAQEGSYLAHAVKSFIQGAAALPAAVPQDMAASAQNFSRLQIPVMDRIDRGEAVRLIDDPTGYSQMTPEQRAEFRKTYVPAAMADPRQTTLSKLGTSLKEATTFTPEPGFEGRTWTGDIAGGAGSLMTGMLTSMIPGVGTPAAMTMFVSSGRQEARDNALKAKATPEQQERAAQLGTVAGATDIVDTLLPKMGSLGAALSLVKRVGVRALETAFIEGGQEGLQQFIQNVVSQQVHTPEQELLEGVPRSAAVGAILGGGTGGIVGGLQKPPQAPPTPEQIKAAWDELRTAPTAELKAASNIFEGEPQPVFYSQLKRSAEEKGPDSASAEQWLSTLQNQPGVKQEEIDATGLEDFLASQGPKIAKADVVAFLEENSVQVQEVLKDNHIFGEGSNNPAADPQYKNNITPGPQQNYRELLLTTPAAQVKTFEVRQNSNGTFSSHAPSGQFGSSGGTFGTREEAAADAEQRNQEGRFDSTNFRGNHWTEPNVLAHVRFTERTDASGKPVLHIEEIQSDWHQAGRKKGYADPNLLTQSIAAARQARQAYNTALDGGNETVIRDTQQKLGQANEAVIAAERQQGMPDAPFKTSWPELTFKRMLRFAADNGFTRISWNNGSAAARWAAGGTTDPKAVAGLAKFYDEIIPSIARKLAKKYGGTYGETAVATATTSMSPAQRPDGTWGIRVDNGETIYPVHQGENADASYLPTEAAIQTWIAKEIETTASERVGYIDIPPRSLAVIQQGQPLFSKLDSEVKFRTTDSVQARYDAGDPLVRGAVNALDVVKGILKKFKMDAKIEFVFSEGTLQVGLRGGGRAVGSAEKLARGKYRIFMDLSFYKRTGDVYATLMHEVGHVMMWELFEISDASTKLAIRNAFDNYVANDVKGARILRDILRKRDNALIVHSGMRGTGQNRMNAMTPEQIRYWAGFEEWFAEQVARWATTSERPLTVADKIFKKLGDMIRNVTESMSKSFGLSYRASPAMEAWLDSFMEAAPVRAKDIFDANDLKTKKDNKDALDKAAKDIPAAPQQPETIGIRAGIDKLFPPGTPAPPAVQEAAAHADRMNWLYKFMAGLDQLVDANPLFAPLARYAERVRMMHLEESKIHDAALRVGKRWRALGTKQGEALTALLDDVTNMVYRTDDEIARGVGRHPTQAEFQALVGKHKVGGKSLEVFSAIKKMFDAFLDKTSQNARDEAMRLITNPTNLANRLDQINAMVANLRSRPYFPFMRFGRHFVQVKDAAGKTVHFETFERRGLMSAASRQRAKAKQLETGTLPGEVVTFGVLPESVDPLIGMPPLLLQAMRERLELTPEQLDALEQLQFEVSPALSFKHRFQHKNYTAGYAMDFKRSFARYFFHGGRFFAKTKYAWQLRDDIAEARKVNGNNAGEIANYMADHLKNTVLDAKGDFGIFKAGIFLWALGYVPAAAFQNLTQTPMITFPFLAGKFGDIRATRAITRAMANVTNFYKRGHYDNQTEFELRAFGYGIKTGRISETQAPELAGMSNGAGLMEGLGGNKVQRGWQAMMEKSAFMFEMAEQVNRRVAYRAALDLAQQQPNAKVVNEAVAKYNDEYKQLLGEYSEAQARAIVTANHVVDQTQYVYARYARPRFMRGRVSGTLFVFKKYMQSTLFMLGHNKSDVLPRYMLIAMLLGGLAGLPGYDDMKDIIKLLGKWLFGKNWDAEKATREFVVNNFNGTVPPDLILHGLARRGFGLPALVDMIGSTVTGKPGRGFDPAKAGQNVPFPVIDRSRALSMGNLLPVELGKLFNPMAKDINSTIGEQTQKASGAAFSVGFNIYKAIMDNHMEASDPKRWERAVPRVLASASKAYRAFDEGRERSRGGPNSASTIVTYDRRDTEQMMEIIALAGGYQPLRVQAKWDSIMAKTEVQKYYDFSRTALLEQMHEAISSGNRAEVDEVSDAMIKFNQGLPDWAKGKALSEDTVQRSMQARERAKVARESGVPIQATNRGISQEMDRLYPEAVVDVRRVR